MDKVYDLKEAREWFLKHSEGGVRCVDRRNGVTDAESYPAAEHFFNRNVPTNMPQHMKITNNCIPCKRVLKDYEVNICDECNIKGD